MPLVFGTFVPYQGVDGLISILGIARQAPCKKGRICEPVINLAKMFLKHLVKMVWLVRAREPFLVFTP